MAGSVIIKSYNRGLSIHMDPEASIDTIKNDLQAKLEESAAFFRDATVAISFEDRELDSQTERELVNIITSASSIKVACIAGKNKLTQDLITNAIGEVEYKSEVGRDVSVQILKETIKDGRIVDVPGSILIMGDVYPGSSVVAGGDVFVFGSLLGQAYAGNGGDADRVVAAVEMNPEKLRIAGIKFKPLEKPRWTIKPKQVQGAKLAHLVGTEIVFSPIDQNFWKRYHYGAIQG